MTTLALLLCGLLAAAPAKPAVQPVILDTDIGGDIDDTWALTALLRSPELSLKLVTTENANTLYRARLVAKLLETNHRGKVPIGIGLKESDDLGGQAGWVGDYDLTKYPGKVYQDGVQALIDTIMASKQKITVIALGPSNTLAAAVRKEPRICEKARLVGMFGSLRVGYEGAAKPCVEWNVKGAIEAAKTILSAPWDITITPLDTCGLVHLDGGAYKTLLGSADPMVKTMLDNYRCWLGDRVNEAETHSSVLFDTVAVYLAITQDLCVMEDLGVTVTDDGMTKIDPAGKVIHCATSWKDLNGYYGWLLRRLLGVK